MTRHPHSPALPASLALPSSGADDPCSHGTEEVPDEKVSSSPDSVVGVSSTSEKILVFGAFAPRLTEQLAGAVSESDVFELQKDADAITRLSVRGLLGDGAVDSARRRLIEKIVAAKKAKH